MPDTIRMFIPQFGKIVTIERNHPYAIAALADGGEAEAAVVARPETSAVPFTSGAAAPQPEGTVRMHIDRFKKVVTIDRNSPYVQEQLRINAAAEGGAGRGEKLIDVDALGKQLTEDPPAPPVPVDPIVTDPPVVQTEANVTTLQVTAIAESPEAPASKALKDLSLEELAQVATLRGVVGQEHMSRQKKIDAVLASWS